MSTSDIKLVSVFMILVATLILRIKVESTGYCSPDSMDFLEVSQNIIDGKGFYHTITTFNDKGEKNEIISYFSLWPIGYPILIAGFSSIFSLPVFWASKLVNIFFLSLIFMMFRKISKSYAYLLSLNLCSFTFLEIFSYTWSEAPFIFGILWFVYALYKFLKAETSLKNFTHLLSSSLFLFLIRYIGGFSLIIIGGLALRFFIQKKLKVALRLFFLVFLLSITIALYLYNNYLQTDYLTGGERFYPNKESLSLFTWYLSNGLLNEFFIIRKYYWQDNANNILFWITAIFQIVFYYFIYLKILKSKFQFFEDFFLAKIHLIIGFSYLIILIFIRAFSPFDPFDYRLLSPFSICIFTAFMLLIIQPEHVAISSKVNNYITIFFIFSLLLNLPKEYLLQAFWSIVENK